MNAKNIIPFDEYNKKILYKDPSNILLDIFPKLSHPSQSRFHELFKKKEEISTRKRANEYGKLIRPKSSGHINIVKKHNDNKKIILKNEVNKKNKGEIEVKMHYSKKQEKEEKGNNSKEKKSNKKNGNKEKKEEKKDKNEKNGKNGKNEEKKSRKY